MCVKDRQRIPEITTKSSKKRQGTSRQQPATKRSRQANTQQCTPPCTPPQQIDPTPAQRYQEGEVVALRCIQYNESPQLGQVLEVKQSKATIKCTWSSKWKVYAYKDGRKTVAWIETLSVNDIIVGNTELTKSGSLPRTNSRICITH